MKICLTLSMMILGASALLACSPAASDSPKSGAQKAITSDDSKPGETKQEPVAEKPKATIPTEESEEKPEEPKVYEPTFTLVGGIDVKSEYVRLGEIRGWAVNKNDLKSYLMVNFYLDGDNKTGKKLGSLKANLVMDDGGNGDEHGFFFSVPKESIDFKAHKIYIYAVVNDKEVELSEQMPYALDMYKPRGGAAEDMYKAIGFSSCGGNCHRWDYQQIWERLARNADGSDTWNETSNYLMNKKAGPHGGGDFCYLLKNSGCNKIPDWWKLEFAK